MHALRSWMFSDAIAMLDRAEQMQRRFFEVGVSSGGSRAGWEAPVDILLSDDALLLIVALPGVLPERIVVEIEGSMVRIRGDRTLPVFPKQSHLLRLEIPHGVFERGVVLPPGKFALDSQEAKDGCLYLLFHRMGVQV
jgi:HSP20 family protein